MKKLILLLTICMWSLHSMGQTELATWSLTNGANATSINGVTASAITPAGIVTNYSGTGFRTNAWTDTFAATDYFQIAVKPSGASAITVTGLNFNQTRNGDGPTNYKIKYYISNSGSTITNNQFFNATNNGDVTWVNSASIANNGTVQLTLPSAITLSTTQELFIRF